MEDNNIVIGSFCSTAEKDTYVYPKEIPGYKSPEPQILKEDNQQFEFVYTPIVYNINYNLDGGEVNSELKSSYTIEDDSYTPPVPTKKDFVFNGWKPKSIPAGSIGDINFTATWKSLPILKTGKELNEIFNSLANGKENILGFRIVDCSVIYEVTDNFVDISSTITPIYTFYDSGIIYFACEDAIHCNEDMSHAFEGLSLLSDISCFSYLVAADHMNCNSMFKDCTALSDVQSTEYWNVDKTFEDITDAFLNTSALESGRTPNWYNWEVNIQYISSTGKILKNINENHKPREVIYPSNIEGYTCNTNSITIDSSDKVYTFIYTPIEYDIRYSLGEGVLPFAKTTYNIEEEDFYPAKPVKDEYTFTNWEPEYIPSGSTGNYNFIANYTPNN
jgi:hypothetical protein